MNAWVAETTDELIDARLRMGDVVRFTVPTWSMYPALMPGDQVIVCGARAAELRVGEVVILKSNAAASSSAPWVAHRLIARRVVDGALRLVTKGDNCSIADAPWSGSLLIGRVIAVQQRRATQPTDLMSGRARVASVFLAGISRGQWFVQRTLSGPCAGQKSDLSLS